MSVLDKTLNCIQVVYDSISDKFFVHQFLEQIMFRASRSINNNSLYQLYYFSNNTNYQYVKQLKIISLGKTNLFFVV